MRMTGLRRSQLERKLKKEIWSVFDSHPLTQIERVENKKDFGREGSEWEYKLTVQDFPQFKKVIVASNGVSTNYLEIYVRIKLDDQTFDRASPMLKLFASEMAKMKIHFVPIRFNCKQDETDGFVLATSTLKIRILKDVFSAILDMIYSIQCGFVVITNIGTLLLPKQAVRTEETKSGGASIYC